MFAKSTQCSSHHLFTVCSSFSLKVRCWRSQPHLITSHSLYTPHFLFPYSSEFPHYKQFLQFIGSMRALRASSAALVGMQALPRVCAGSVRPRHENPQAAYHVLSAFHQTHSHTIRCKMEERKVEILKIVGIGFRGANDWHRLGIEGR